jgi:hypothetical protein
MKILGFNFTKLQAEKGINKKEGIKINTHIDISKIEFVNPGEIKVKEDLLGVSFKFDVSYDPDFAKISFEGNIILAVESKLHKEVLKQWKENKIPEDFKLPLFNIIIKKSTLKALQFEEELNLPLHIPMPSLKSPDKKE